MMPFRYGYSLCIQAFNPYLRNIESKEKPPGTIAEKLSQLYGELDHIIGTGHNCAATCCTIQIQDKFVQVCTNRRIKTKQLRIDRWTCVFAFSRSLVGHFCVVPKNILNSVPILLLIENKIILLSISNKIILFLIDSRPIL